MYMIAKNFTFYNKKIVSKIEVEFLAAYVKCRPEIMSHATFMTKF